MPDDVKEEVPELQELFEEPVSIQIGAKTYALRPLTVLEIGPMNRAIHVVLAMMGNDAADERLARLVGERATDLLPFVACSSGVSAEDLAQMDGGRFMKLLEAALEVNRDFFAHCFALRFGSTGMKLLQMIGGPGLAQSTTSATADTPSASATPQPDSVAS